MPPKNPLPPPGDALRAIQKYITKHGGLESRDDQDTMLREILTPQYTKDLDDDEVSKKVTKLRHILSTICSSSSISRVLSVEWRKIEHKDKFRLQDLFLSGPSKIFPRDFLEKRGIEVADQSDSEDEGDESGAGEAALTRGEKRKAEDSEEDHGMVLGEKRQKNQVEAQNNFQSPLAIRNGTPGSARKLQQTPNQRAQSVLTPSKDQAAPREAWAREAGARANAALLPTHKPVNPNEILPASDAAWASQQMEDLYKNIWDATLSAFQQFNISEEAEAKFVPTPDPELLELYDTIFKSGDWPQIRLKLSMTNQDEVFTQEYAVMALMGAAIFKMVFETDLQWDISIQVREALGEDTTQLLSEVIKDLGHDFDTVLKYATGKEIASKKFQEEKVAVRARELANTLIVILEPHLKRSTMNDAPAPESRYRPWYEDLSEAFQKAIVIKLTLNSSKLGPFKYVWPRPDQEINPQFHKAAFDLGVPCKILAPILPVIARVDREPSQPNKHIIFARARVVPMKSSEQNATPQVAAEEKDDGEAIPTPPRRRCF